MRRSIGTFIALLFLLCLRPPCSHAQYAPHPQAYSLTEFNGLLGIPMTREISRDGTKIFVDMTTPPSRPGSKGSHTRTFWDLERHASYTWDPADTGRPCGPSVFDGDGSWGDPFVTSSSMTGELIKGGAKRSGTETVNGIAADVFVISSPEAKAKVWIEPKYGMVVRLDMGMGNSPVEKKYEVKSLSFSQPASSVFALPPACSAAMTKPLPKTESQIKAEVTGNRSDDFLDNNSDYPDPVAQKNSCTVLFRVVHEKTLEPVRSGFQVALMTGDVVNHPPRLEIGLGTDGRAHFSAYEVTGQLRDGVLRIPNVPKDFEIYLHMINADGGGESLMHRECFHPEQVLLAVVPATKGKPGDPPVLSHWLWVKSGPLATVPGAASLPAPATPPAPHPISAAGPAKVTAVHLHLVPESYTGPCPSPIQLVADITTDGPGTVWYSFLSGAVAKKTPQEGTLNFEAAGTKSVTLEGTIRDTPRVPYTRVLAAMQDEQGRHGPQTTRSEDVPYNRTCQAK